MWQAGEYRVSSSSRIFKTSLYIHKRRHPQILSTSTLKQTKLLGHVRLLYDCCMTLAVKMLVPSFGVKRNTWPHKLFQKMLLASFDRKNALLLLSPMFCIALQMQNQLFEPNRFETTVLGLSNCWRTHCLTSVLDDLKMRSIHLTTLGSSMLHFPVNSTRWHATAARNFC